MKEVPSLATSPGAELRARLFSACFGAFLGLALLKFGNPPIFEPMVLAPTNPYEVLLNSPWPVVWGYRLLGLVAVFGLFVARWPAQAPRWLVALPLVWLAWQLLAATHSVDATLTRLTLHHLIACVVCFYLGLFCLSRVRPLGWFWPGLLVGFLFMLAVGWDQHFGGLENTRHYFYLYVYPELKAQMKEIPPEFLKKISSNRIWGTLFYPNALAGALLLLGPALLGVISLARRRFTAGARGFLVAVVGLGALACLYWSGSKGGWLLMLLLCLVALFRLPLARSIKLALLAGVLLAGLSGFLWKYSGFFQKGATSVSARFDYWRAAVQTVRANPLLGTGPGTFFVAYQQFKRPEAEMTRLVHNDYLEQATDSGLPGCLVYTLFMAGALVWSFPKAAMSGGSGSGPIRSVPPAAGSKAAATAETADTRGWAWGSGPGDWEAFTIWLGVLGWALQGFLEFGLYIPGLAWPAFAFLGWLLAQAREER